MAQEQPHYAQGNKPPRPPIAPSPGEEERLEDWKQDGVPRWVKTAAAVAGVLATIAGICFGVLQFMNSNRQFSLEREKEDHEFQLSMQKAQSEQQAANESATQALQGEITQQKKADAEKAEADASAEAARNAEAQAGAEQAKANLARDQLDQQHQDTSAERAAKAEVAKRQTVDMENLAQAIAKLRASAREEDAVTAMSRIVAFLSSEDSAVKTRALEAINERLSSDLFPTKTEIDLIFSSLPDASPEGIDIAVSANRRAWRQLAGAMQADWDAAHSQATTSKLDPSQVDEQWTARVQADIAMLRMSRSIGTYLAGDNRGRTYTNPDAPGTAQNLDSVIAMIVGSRNAIEEMVSNVPEGSTVDLDDCFLPGFAPRKASQAATIRFGRSFLVGGDLTQLGDTPSMVFADESPDPFNVGLIRFMSPNDLAIPDILLIHRALLGNFVQITKAQKSKAKFLE
jgi:chemotaxis protein histidine kinase CheA